jgi:hypothetical protein
LNIYKYLYSYIIPDLERLFRVIAAVIMVGDEKQ